MKSPKELPVLRTYHLKTVFLWMAEEVNVCVYIQAWYSYNVYSVVWYSLN